MHDGDDQTRGSGRHVVRSFVLVLLFVGLTAVVILELSSVRELVRAILSASWYWIVVSALLFIASFYLWALLYHVGFRVVGVSSSTLGLMTPLMISILLNTAAPLGEAIFVEDAVERGQSGARAAAGVILVLVVDLATMLPFVIGGLLFLQASGKLPLYQIVVSLLFILVIAVLIAMLWLARVRKSWLEASLRGLQSAYSWVARLFKRRGAQSETWPLRSAEQFSQASASMSAQPWLLVLSTAVGLLFHVVNATGLYTLFLAFGQQAALGTVIAGFSMSVVFSVIAVTPQGVGATEGVMSLLFSSAGIPAAVSVGVAVIYRFFNVWIPIVLGYALARRLRLFGGKAARI